MQPSVVSDLGLHCLSMYYKKGASHMYKSGFKIRVCNWKLFLNQNRIKSVVGTQKNRLNKIFLLSTQNTCLTLFKFYNQTCLKSPLKKKTELWFSRLIIA